MLFPHIFVSTHTVWRLLSIDILPRICQGLRKPSNVKYSQLVQTRTQNIADAAIAETDHLIPYLIRLRQLSEEVNQAFNYDSSANLPQLNSVQTEILRRAFEQQLDHIEATFPPEVWENCKSIRVAFQKQKTNVSQAQIKLNFHSLRIYVNEVGFHATAPAEFGSLSELSAPSWYSSAARNDCLIRCLKATKTYLEQFLLLPDSEISSMVTFDLLQLVYAVLILGSFSSGFDAPNLDQTQVRKSANLEYYLNAVSDRFTRLISVQDPAADSYKYHMNTLFQTSKRWYVQMVTDPSPAGPGYPRFFFMDILGTMTSRCADFSTACAMSEATLEDQWTEMLSEWVASSMDMSTDGTLIRFQA